MKIEKVYPAGWKMELEDKTIYFGEYGQFGCYCNEGVVYKDEHAFKTGEGVCYIPEYDFDNAEDNATDLFEMYAKEAVASGLERNSYTTTDGFTRKDLEELCKDTGYDAEDLFHHLDWMNPETLIDEWLDDDEEQERYNDCK